ncbi:unnamed protein product [Clonostachys rosea]|uniref:Uncharacterized protein n=1 Tax=Bionectria ochroleuca TaxID=29856 RepID=A0ABY6TQ47_BIOOC|nr:unnamed protein product [Clonostachys rosea]
MGPTAAERCFAEPFVAPHWLPGSQAFWHRRQISDEENLPSILPLVSVKRLKVKDAILYKETMAAVEPSEKHTKSTPQIWAQDGQLWLLDKQRTESQLIEAESSEESCCSDEMQYLCPNNAFAVAWATLIANLTLNL